MSWSLLVLALAWADEPPPPPAEPAEVKIVVIGERLRIERARQEIIRRLRAEGYTEEIRRGEVTVLRHPAAWAGEVWIHDDGWVTVKRQPVQVSAPQMGNGPLGQALGWASCVVVPFGCVHAGGQTFSKRKWRGVESRTFGSIQPEVAGYGDRVADLHTREVIEALPDRLYALWESGVPLEGDATILVPVEDRKRALLLYWEGRTDTVWGDRVRLAVEAFVRAEVQTGDRPFTDAEVAAFNAGRRCARAFDLTSPWELVSVGLDGT